MFNAITNVANSVARDLSRVAPRGAVRRSVAIVGVPLLASVALLIAAPAAQAATERTSDVALRALVLDDGSAEIAAIAARLTAEGVPTTRVDLTAKGRATITAAYLVTGDASTVHGQYAAVVSPNEAPEQLSADERSVLATYESTFAVRELITKPKDLTTLGLNAAAYHGKVDGVTATLTPAALSGAFSYLKGSMTIAAGRKATTAVLATPAGTAFTPLVTTTIPGSGQTASLAGVYADGGRERLVLGFSADALAPQTAVLGHGLITWLTRGISTSINRNYLTVQVDGVLSGAACPSGDVCLKSNSALTSADVKRLVAWQQENGLTLELAFNGAGTTVAAGTVSVESASESAADAVDANKGSLRFVNDTWSGTGLGCTRNASGSCVKSAKGVTAWTSLATMTTEIQKNTAYANAHGLTNYAAAELVLPDPSTAIANPNFATAVSVAKVRWIADDASVRPNATKVGTATTVPRYLLSANAADTAATVTARMVSNDPRPHAAAQSEITGEASLLSTLTGVIDTYEATFNESAPLVSPTLTQSGQELLRRQAWDAATADVPAVVSGDHVSITNKTGALIDVPVTVPTGTKVLAWGKAGAEVGSAYAGSSSAWMTLAVNREIEFQLPAASGYPTSVVWEA